MNLNRMALRAGTVIGVARRDPARLVIGMLVGLVLIGAAGTTIRVAAGGHRDRGDGLTIGAGDDGWKKIGGQAGLPTTTTRFRWVDTTTTAGVSGFEPTWQVECDSWVAEVECRDGAGNLSQTVVPPTTQSAGTVGWSDPGTVYEDGSVRGQAGCVPGSPCWLEDHPSEWSDEWNDLIEERALDPAWRTEPAVRNPGR